MGKASIGVLMIVKNEKKHLASCLESVKDWVDEIVIVDSGSTDNTLSIAKSFTDKVYKHEDWQGFGKQRQIAQSYMTSTWVLPLDADERVTEELKASIIKVVEQNENNVVYKLNRLSKAFGKTIRFSGWSPDWVVRLYKRESTGYTDSLVHEKVKLPENCKQQKLDGRLSHYTFDNLSQYVQKNSLYMKSWADQREGKKKSSLLSAITHSFFCFFKMYIIKLGFMDGRHGLLLAIISASTTFIRYSDLWLREYNKDE